MAMACPLWKRAWGGHFGVIDVGVVEVEDEWADGLEEGGEG